MNLINIFGIIFLINIFLSIIDKIFCLTIISYFGKHLKDKSRIRWYLLHIVINIFTVITSINGVYMSFNKFYTNLSPIKMAKPLTNSWFFGPTSPIPTLIVASGHLYHILFFSTSKEDIYHHVLFAGTMSFINMIGDYGYARNIIQFVLSGLPGIFEYFIMSIYKFEFIGKKKMRYLITIMHCILRCPLGLLIGINFIYQLKNNKNINNPIMVFIISLLVILNSTQYCYENIRSSIKHYSKND